MTRETCCRCSVVLRDTSDDGLHELCWICIAEEGKHVEMVYLLDELRAMRRRLDELEGRSNARCDSAT
jgi:hypothetical protein